jgi:alpha-glucuronidase
MNCKRIVIITATLGLTLQILAEDGYRLWLRYDRINNPEILAGYQRDITGWMYEGRSAIIQSAKSEIKNGLKGLLGKEIPEFSKIDRRGIILAGIPANSKILASLHLEDKLEKVGEEGYIIFTEKYKGKKIIVIAANSDVGILYGTFRLLRLLQIHTDISQINLTESPKIMHRLLNHWDNLNRTVERGYAGLSLWEWGSLPDSLSSRYIDYARANASIGINGTVITNVNANARVLTKEYLVKVASLADLLRNYGLKVYLTARFSAPVELGGLKTADPLDTSVIKWWRNKAEEIYSYIPDFGGFVVKANSEGQPGPQNYDRNHAEGANMLADAVAPFGGIVMWRAFVYDNNVPDDRAKQAYNEFVPLDGKFRDNVLIQVKNGPVDFQPREPFHPLFGSMPLTNLMLEFQITQEYLGSSVHLVFLAPLYEECLKSDTWANGKGTTVASIIDGTSDKKALTAMAGVSNAGSVTNWTGHPFGQSNWYAYGRLAWNPYLSSSEIADEWIRMTFSNSTETIDIIRRIMLESREAAVDYMTPLGLHHIMYAGHHYGPGPWVDRGRRDWTSVYYHNADSAGIGFDRTSSGSKAVEQYFPKVRDLYENLSTCPENLLLWFHHLPWDYRMKSGKTLWEELCIKYHEGVNKVRWMQEEWTKIKLSIDNERFTQVQTLLDKQERDAKIWRDGCLLYFQTFSGRPFPDGLEKPEHDLNYYINHRYTDIPGIR